MAVRARERAQRRTSEQECLQQPLLDDRDAARLHALVVVFVVPHQLGVAAGLQRRIEDDAEERRQDRLVDLGRRTSGRRRRCAAGCPRRGGRRSRGRRRPRRGRREWRDPSRVQPAALCGGAASSFIISRASLSSWLLVGQPIERAREVAVVQRQLHPVVGLGRGLDEEAVLQIAGGDPRAFAVGVGSGCRRAPSARRCRRRSADRRRRAPRCGAAALPTPSCPAYSPPACRRRPGLLAREVGGGTSSWTLAATFVRTRVSASVADLKARSVARHSASWIGLASSVSGMRDARRHVRAPPPPPSPRIGCVLSRV